MKQKMKRYLPIEGAHLLLIISLPKFDPSQHHKDETSPTLHLRFSSSSTNNFPIPTSPTQYQQISSASKPISLESIPLTDGYPRDFFSSLNRCPADH